ncbi:hypothetical protein BL254_00320 [Protofrankia sp. BMG5.30]|nr:hypothetical protein BL254_00320 [Protofrankia sp. BMG5.30]
MGSIMRVSVPSAVPVTLVVAAALLLVAGCNGSSSGSSRSSSGRSSHVSKSSDSNRTGTTGTQRSTPLATASASASPARDGDVDGDGRTDSIALPAAGTLRVRYATGHTDEVPFQGNPDLTVQGVLGSVDADRDGHAEVFVRVDRGAGLQAATVFRYVGSRLRLVTLDGQQASLPYGASLRNAAKWGCRRTQSPAAAIEIWTGTSTDGRSYQGRATFYNFSDSRLITRGQSTPTPPPQNLTCGSVKFT